MQVLHILLLVFIISCAVSVSLTKNLLTALVIFMGQSLAMSVIWILLESPDLAITEAAVGAGITSLLLFVTLKKIHAIDIQKGTDKTTNNVQEGEKSWFPRLLKWLDGGSGLLDDAMAHELDEGSEEHLLPDSQDALTRETKFEQHRQESLDKDETLYERYHQWAHTRGKKLLTWLYRLLAVVVCFSIIWVLLQTASYLPPFGNPDNPVNNEVSQRYIEKGMEETGAVNIVAGMILDYRAFDTLGESNVLFIAACSVLILLRVSGSKDGKPSTEQLEAEADDRMYEPKNDAILQHAANFLVPLILMFGVYVILNGHISPGGGFSGGAIMGAGLILYLNAFGFKRTERFFTFTTFKIVSCVALSFYALSKAYSFFTGANHLPSIITTGTPGMIFSAGLIPYLNIAVGLVVCCTMYAFYTLFRKGDM